MCEVGSDADIFPLRSPGMNVWYVEEIWLNLWDLKRLDIPLASLMCGSWSTPTGISVGMLPSNSGSWTWNMSDAWSREATILPGDISP